MSLAGQHSLTDVKLCMKHAFSILPSEGTSRDSLVRCRAALGCFITFSETAIGRLGYEALPHKLLPVCMPNSVALVALDHSDGQIRMRRPCR